MKSVYYCKKCNSCWIGDGVETICPDCGQELLNTNVDPDAWKSKTRDEKNQIKQQLKGEEINMSEVENTVNTTENVSTQTPTSSGSFVYKTVPGPMTVGRDNMSIFADIMNEQAKQGWTYHSMETLTVTEKPGCFSPTVPKQYYMLIFYKQA